MRPALRRVAPLAALVALATLLLVPAGCGGDDPAPTDGVRRGRYDASGRLVEGTRSRAALPNIVVLVLDTLRADAIRGRDGAPPTMPRLAAWAEGAVDFVDASSPAAWTAPCVTSMLTGLAPSDHGVQGHIAASPLAPSITTLAEILKEAGYATTALTGGGWVSRAMGLGQGFDHFVESWHTGDPRKALQRALAEHPRERPLFLLLHTYEAHDPYGRKEPPEGHDDPARVAAANAEAVRLARRRGRPARGAHHRRGPRVAPRLAQRPAPARRAHDPPHARTRRGRRRRLHLDRPREGPRPRRHRGDPARPLRPRRRRARRRRRAHPRDPRREPSSRAARSSSSSPTTARPSARTAPSATAAGSWTRSPACCSWSARPGHFKAGVIRGSCGGIDLTPTILDLVGLPVPVGSPGRSLLPQARGRAGGEPVLAEDFRRQPADPATPGPDITFRVVTVRTERAKLHLLWDPRTDTTAATLFDLVADPAEAHPLPPTDLARFGPAFVAACARARDHVATFHGRTDNHGNGRFQGE